MKVISSSFNLATLLLATHIVLPSPEGRVYPMKKLPANLLITSLVLTGVLLLALQLGVWLPDIFDSSPHTLAEQRLPSGHRFQVVQYWNHRDFYSTELRVTTPDGSTTTHTLDGDDSKSWSLPLLINEQHRTATVTLGGNRVKTVEWK